MKNNKTIKNPSEKMDKLDSLVNAETNNTNVNNDDDTNLENSQEIPFAPENSLDKNEVIIPLTLGANVTSTKKYKVLLSTETKFVLDLEERGGYSCSHSTYTKSLNFKTGDYILIPKEGN